MLLASGIFENRIRLTEIKRDSSITALCTCRVIDTGFLNLVGDRLAKLVYVQYCSSSVRNMFLRQFQKIKKETEQKKSTIIGL